MRIRIEIEPEMEEEVVIRCRSLNKEVNRIQQAITDITLNTGSFSFFKDETEYYISLEDILFFETDTKGISVHTRDNVYQTKYKLYELEKMLPGYFVRVSKSTILNVKRIFSISRNLSSASIVQFQDTHKQVYVSRRYFKQLKEVKEAQMRSRG